MGFEIEHIHLTDPDPKKVADFYVNAMGAKITKELNTEGRIMISLDLAGKALRISNYTGVDGVWKGLQYGLHHFGMMVENLDKAAVDLKKTGVEFVIPVTTSQTGSKYMFIKTKHNVLIEIMEKSK